MSRFIDSAATIITCPSTDISEKNIEEVSLTNPIGANVSFMGAVTKPLEGGSSTSVDATIIKDNDQNITYIHQELGWCINFIPANGVLSQMTQLQDLRENHPSDASELCKKCEHLIQIASIGGLEDFRLICGDIIAIPSWKSPPPLWYVGRMFVAAVCRGNLPIVQWLIEGGVSPRSLPPVAEVLHDVVSRFVVGNDGGATTLQVITYLVIDGNFDVSKPRKGDGWTPLHLAAQRNLLIVAKHLIKLGADVNAIGRDDIMPLNLADRIAKMLRPMTRNNDDDDEQESDGDEANEDGEGNEVQTETDQSKEDENEKVIEQKEEEEFVTPLQTLLIQKGARRTWRREPVITEEIPKKAQPVRFTGGFTQQDIQSEEGTSTSVQRADGGFTFSCE